MRSSFIKLTLVIIIIMMVRDFIIGYYIIRGNNIAFGKSPAIKTIIIKITLILLFFFMLRRLLITD